MILQIESVDGAIGLLPSGAGHGFQQPYSRAPRVAGLFSMCFVNLHFIRRKKKFMAIQTSKVSLRPLVYFSQDMTIVSNNNIQEF